MKLGYQQHKGRRIKRSGFYSITTLDGYWWIHDSHKWVSSEEARGRRSTHFDGCRNVKQFRRLLRQWSTYLPKGVEFTLVSVWKRHDVYGRIR